MLRYLAWYRETSISELWHEYSQIERQVFLFGHWLDLISTSEGINKKRYKQKIWVQCDRSKIPANNCPAFLSWLTLSLNYLLFHDTTQNTRTSGQKYSHLIPQKNLSYLFYVDFNLASTALTNLIWDSNSSLEKISWYKFLRLDQQYIHSH